MRKFVVIPGNNPGVIKRAVLKRGNWDDISEEKGDGDVGYTQFVWKPTNLSIRAYALMDSNPLHPDYVQIINHFENNRGICTKTGLIRSLRSYYYHNEQANLHRYTLFESTPTTFLITAGDENQEYVNFIARFRDIAKKQFTKEHIPEKHCQENLWLIKPANMNQGRGIEIFNSLKDIQSFISTQTANSFWVAQKYIEKPLLYYGRKFDIRVWVLVTAKMEVFFYRTPYMRTSSNEYVTDAFDNYIHLTNNCLQKHGDNFGRFESGNTLPLSSLQGYIDDAFPDHGVSVEKHLIPRMKDLIIDTLLSIKKSMNPKRRKNCFELFGYDFLIDEDYRTWLLEVNTNPYLGVPNEFIKTMLPEMVDDMLKIVLDPHYPPSNPDAIPDRENKFDLIYCEHHSAYHQGPLNVRSRFSENIYPVPSIAPPLRHVRAPPQAADRTPKDADHSASNASLKAQADKEFLEKCKVELANSEFPGFGLVRNNKPQKKPATMIAVEPTTEIVQVSSTPLSGRTGEKRKSATATAPTTSTNQQSHHVNNNGVIETAKKIDDLLESYSVFDQEHFMPLISKVLSVLTNWELQSDKEISTACKSILTLSESRMCGSLTEPSNIIQMIDLLNSQNVPLKVQVTTVTAFLNICKKISEMKKIICDKMIHALTKIILASCDSTLIQNYDLQVIKLSIKCLSALAGKYDRKMYIPGETRDFDLVREFLINQGGIIGLMIVSKCSVDEEIREMPNKSCFSYLSSSDWELQKAVLEKVKEGKYNLISQDSSEETETPSSANHVVKAKQTKGFLFVGSSSMVLPSKNNKSGGESNKNNAQQPTDKMPNLPKNLLERSDYPIDSMIADVEEKISKLKETKKKREQEEEEKREQALMDQMREQQQKEQLLNEKRRKAEEVFLKRLEEKKKVQEEVAKRTEEESKQRFIQEEERKKVKIQELLKRKEEYDQKTKKFELKKKRLEEEMRKMVDEELEKKKLQRKALEESFWSRIKAKQKEKQLDKLTKTEETKRTNSLAISNIELSHSVDPSKSQDENSDKTRMLRTHHFNTPQHSIEDGKAITFSSFFKEDIPIDLRKGRHGNKTSISQEPRQRSVEDNRTKKKDECVSLPCIDGSSRSIRTVNEKVPKALRQSNLFTLNEAIEEETAYFGEDLSKSHQSAGRRVIKQYNPLRSEAEKLKKITSSENMKPMKNTSGVREILIDRYRDKEKEKEKVRDLIRQSPYGQLLKQTNPQELDSNLNQNATFKIYVQGARRKFKLQQTIVKN